MFGRNSGPKCQQKHVGVYVRVSLYRKMAWPWPWRPGHINNNCGKVLHDDLAWPNMASATWLRTWIIKHLLVHTEQSRPRGQFRFTYKYWELPNVVFDCVSRLGHQTITVSQEFRGHCNKGRDYRRYMLQNLGLSSGDDEPILCKSQVKHDWCLFTSHNRRFHFLRNCRKIPWYFKEESFVVSETPCAHHRLVSRHQLVSNTANRWITIG
jgi:hypothetical protein